MAEGIVENKLVKLRRALKGEFIDPADFLVFAGVMLKMSLHPRLWDSKAPLLPNPTSSEKEAISRGFDNFTPTEFKRRKRKDRLSLLIEVVGRTRSHDATKRIKKINGTTELIREYLQLLAQQGGDAANKRRLEAVDALQQALKSSFVP